MSDIKKDHSIGEGTGAVAGASPARRSVRRRGPVGTVVGAIVGGALGAKAGGSVAEASIRPNTTSTSSRPTADAPYYSSERDWSDYQPAYKYGYDTYGQYRGQRFEDVEPQLERDWERDHGEFAPGAGSKPRARCATAGTTSNARCRATPTTTVADRIAMRGPAPDALAGQRLFSTGRAMRPDFFAAVASPARSSPPVNDQRS